MERYMSLTDIGKFYGVSRVVAGRFVVNVGLRDSDGEPTEKALDGGYCKQFIGDYQGPAFWIWHSKTIDLIEECIQDPAAFALDRRKRAEERTNLESQE
jgi:hypothetical protein